MRGRRALEKTPPTEWAWIRLLLLVSSYGLRPMPINPFRFLRAAPNPPGAPQGVIGLSMADAFLLLTKPRDGPEAKT